MKDKIDNFISKLSKNGNIHRLYKLFKTEYKFYFYDVGTGKIFEVSKDEYVVLDDLFNNNKLTDDTFQILSENEVIKIMDRIIELYYREKILQAPILEKFVGPQFDNLEYALNNAKTQLNLELTERCNLRCKYCLYHEGQGGYRTFGKEDMTFEVAKMGLEQLKKTNNEEVYVSFYGGEPLLKFDLMKKCIEYAEETFPEKNISYSFTTNAVLITDSMIEFFNKYKEKLYITFSIDGPQEIHDKNRVTVLGEGTHNLVIKNLEKIVKEFGKLSEEHILINTVISEPSYKTNEVIQEYFDSLYWLPKNMTKFCTQVSTADEEVEYLGINGDREKEMRKKLEKEDNDFAPLITWNRNKILNEINSSSGNISELSSIMKDYMDKELTLIHKRRLSENPMSYYYLNGCCIPGARRIYVTTKGDYNICEKMGPAPKIGNIYDGLNVDVIKEKYIDEFSKKIMPYCGDCWAIHLCPLCYVNAFDEEGAKPEYRHIFCDAHRVLLEESLIIYHEIYEKHPEQLEYLNNIDIS